MPRGGGGSGGQEREPPCSRGPRNVFVNHLDLPLTLNVPLEIDDD